MNKNHEGYHDPTASAAIKRAVKKKKKKFGRSWNRLTYRLEEVPGLKQFMRL